MAGRAGRRLLAVGLLLLGELLLCQLLVPFSQEMIGPGGEHRGQIAAADHRYGAGSHRVDRTAYKCIAEGIPHTAHSKGGGNGHHSDSAVAELHFLFAPAGSCRALILLFPFHGCTPCFTKNWILGGGIFPPPATPPQEPAGRRRSALFEDSALVCCLAFSILAAGTSFPRGAEEHPQKGISLQKKD